MKTATLPALAALAALLACRTAPPAAVPAHPPTAAAPDLAADAPPEAVLPGVSLEGLTPEQKQVVARWARGTYCYCGCPHTVSTCLRTHHDCKHAARMAARAVEVARRGASLPEVTKVVGDYYASFDHRSRLDVAAFGPPLGNADAPLTMVEFSDFTCPFCKALRPNLERWIQAHGAEVKLFYKPFPIESHPGALEAAQAGEWARDQGAFWKMHDALFTTPDHSLDGLADAARTVELDDADLRDAILSRRWLGKVRGSQAEARDAGLQGTPTLYLDGRQLQLLDFTDASLDATLQDELEWKGHGGWERD